MNVPQKVTEKQVETYFKKAITKLGGITFKWSSPAHRGVPDQICVYNGHVYMVELKKPRGGHLSKLQVITINKLIRHGANVSVLWSFDDVDDFIDGICTSSKKSG